MLEGIKTAAALVHLAGALLFALTRACFCRLRTNLLARGVLTRSATPHVAGIKKAVVFYDNGTSDALVGDALTLTLDPPCCTLFPLTLDLDDEGKSSSSECPGVERVEVRYVDVRGQKYRAVHKPPEGPSACRGLVQSLHQTHQTLSRAAKKASEPSPTMRGPCFVLAACLAGKDAGDTVDITPRIRKYMGPNGDWHGTESLTLGDMLPFDDAAGNADRFGSFFIVDSFLKKHTFDFDNKLDLVAALKKKN